MSSEPAPIDITDLPELRELVEEMLLSEEPRLIRVAGVDVAVLSPVKSRERRASRTTKVEREAFLSSAGGWKDLVDTEQLKADIAESRRMSTRPQPKL